MSLMQFYNLSADSLFYCKYSQRKNCSSWKCSSTRHIRHVYFKVDIPKNCTAGTKKKNRDSLKQYMTKHLEILI